MSGRTISQPLRGLREAGGASLLLAGGISAVVGAGLGSLPADYLPFFSAAVLLSLLTVCVLWRAELLAHFVILSAALSGLLRALDDLSLGNTTLSVSGLRWGYVLVVMLMVMLANFKRARIPRWSLPLLALPLWAALMLAVSGVGPVGSKDVLFYTMPFVMLVYMCLLERLTDEGSAHRIERVLLFSVLLPVGFYAVLIPAGLVDFTETGPKGLIGPRAVAVFLLIPQSVGLAVWRYGSDPRQRLVGLSAALISLATIVFTLSRTATLLGLLLFGLSRLRPGKRLRSMLLAIGVVALALAALMAVPRFRERSFFRANLGYFGVAESFNTAGRNQMWPLAFGHGMEQPLVGWGPGSCRLLMGELLVNMNVVEYHPHNEYLQVFHDTGLIGLCLLLLAWGLLAQRQYSRWRQADLRGDRETGRRSLAALLALVALLLSAITDNTFHYAFVVLPVILLVALAERSPQPGRMPSVAPGSGAP